MKTKKVFDYAAIESAAKETTTIESLCARAKINYASFSYYKKIDPEFAAAYERGKSSPGESPAISEDPRAVPHSSKLGQLNTNVVEAVRLGYVTANTIAEYLNEERQSVYNSASKLIEQAKLVKSGSGENSIYALPGELPEPEPEPVESAPPSYSEIERKVISAIENCHCTLLQIKQHAGMEKWFDLSPVIEGMIDDGKIIKMDNGTITGFFDKKHIPSRFFLSGEGTVVCEYPEPEEIVFKPLPDSVLKENTEVENIPLMPTVSEPAPAKEKPKTMKTTKKRRKYTKIKYTREMFLGLGAKNLTQKQIAAKLGVHPTAISKVLIKNVEYAKGYELGKDLYFENHRIKSEVEVSPVENNPQIIDTGEDTIDLTEKDVTGDDPEADANKIDTSKFLLPPPRDFLPSTIYIPPCSESEPDLKFYPEPRKPEIEWLTADQMKLKEHDQKLNEIFATSADLPVVQTQQSTFKVCGGTLTVKLEGINLFESDPSERAFLMDLIKDLEDLLLTQEVRAI